MTKSELKKTDHIILKIMERTKIMSDAYFKKMKLFLNILETK